MRNHVHCSCRLPPRTMGVVPHLNDVVFEKGYHIVRGTMRQFHTCQQHSLLAICVKHLVCCLHTVVEVQVQPFERLSPIMIPLSPLSKCAESFDDPLNGQLDASHSVCFHRLDLCVIHVAKCASPYAQRVMPRCSPPHCHSVLPTVSMSRNAVTGSQVPALNHPHGFGKAIDTFLTLTQTETSEANMVVLSACLPQFGEPRSVWTSLELLCGVFRRTAQGSQCQSMTFRPNVPGQTLFCVLPCALHQKFAQCPFVSVAGEFADFAAHRLVSRTHQPREKNIGHVDPGPLSKANAAILVFVWMRTLPPKRCTCRLRGCTRHARTI